MHHGESRRCDSHRDSHRRAKVACDGLAAGSGSTAPGTLIADYHPPVRAHRAVMLETALRRPLLAEFVPALLEARPSSFGTHRELCAAEVAPMPAAIPAQASISGRHQELWAWDLAWPVQRQEQAA